MTGQEGKGLSIDIGNELSKDLTIHKSVNQEIILTTSDKLRLVLMETKQSLTTKRDWLTPFGLTISFVGTLCTAEFKQTLGLNADFWHALFVLLLIMSSAW